MNTDEKRQEIRVMVRKSLWWHGATLRAGEDGLSQCPNWGSVFAGEWLHHGGSGAAWWSTGVVGGWGGGAF